MFEPHATMPYGAASRPTGEYFGGDGRRLETMFLGTGLADDLDYLVGLLAAERLDPQIGWRGGWDRAAEAVDALLNRRVAGKAVLDL